MMSIETVAASGVADQGKEVFAAEVVDPGKRSLWGSDDVFFCGIIEITEFHSTDPP